MGLTRIAIYRPLFITMLMSAIVVIGLVSYTRLGVDLLPAINFPVVSVVTVYPGAGPESVETLVSKPIEDALAGLGNVDFMVSNSSEGTSVVTLIFTEQANVDAVAIDVERKVNAIRASLPSDILPPSIVRADINADPIMNLAVSGERSSDQIFRIVDERIAPRLSAVDGVASASIIGGRQREIAVKVDQAKLRAHGLSILQVNQALSAENLNFPTGSLEEAGKEVTVRLNALAPSPDSLNDIVVARGAQGTIRLRDIADVQDSFKKVTRIQRVDGRDSVGILITKQAQANTLAVSEGVRAAIDRLQSDLPADIRVDVVTDQAIFTRASLDDVQRNVIEAVILTGVVLLLFLHTFRSTIIVLLAIPTSLIATFIMMWLLGFTLNMMSLMAMALTVGILVDDSIVVLENIFRHLELGETPYSAALKGRSEIGLAAITITLVDVVVYVPVAFMSGIVGQYFRQFGLVIAAATLFSLLVSFTLTPMLASRWLKAAEPESRSPLRRFGAWWDRGYERLAKVYGRVLGWGLKRRWTVVVMGILSLALGVGLVAGGIVPTEFLPEADQGEFTLAIEMPPGSSLETTNQAVRHVEERLAAWPEVKSSFTSVGVGGGGGTTGQSRAARIIVRLVDKHHRSKSAETLAGEARSLGDDIPGLRMRAQMPSLAGPGGQQIAVFLTGDDPVRLRELSAQVEDIFRRTDGTVDIVNSAAEGQPEVEMVIDRAKAADLGLTAHQIGAAVRTNVAGQVVTQFRPVSGKGVDVRVIASDDNRAEIARLEQIPLLTNQGTMIRLGQVVTFNQTAGPPQIDRRNRQRQITVSASPSGRALGEVTGDIQTALKGLSIPDGYQVSFGGASQAQQESFAQLFMALGLSFLLMYMLMVALYESFLYPFIIMLSLPLAIVGAIGGLAVAGMTLNMMSMIGMIMLMGLVGKNAILLVDYTNTLRREGRERNAALLEAGPIRLRPILMTTAAMVAAMLPVAFGIGEGSESRSPMATVVVGGLITSTLLTLLLIPAVYTIMDDLQNLVLRFFKRQPGEPPEPRSRDPLNGKVEREPQSLSI
jgi:hydrophobic/amphiphilic exporter-1 (mainly G- bacteria), HAE1 family